MLHPAARRASARQRVVGPLAAAPAPGRVVLPHPQVAAGRPPGGPQRLGRGDRHLPQPGAVPAQQRAVGARKVDLLGPRAGDVAQVLARRQRVLPAPPVLGAVLALAHALARGPGHVRLERVRLQQVRLGRRHVHARICGQVPGQISRQIPDRQVGTGAVGPGRVRAGVRCVRHKGQRKRVAPVPPRGEVLLPLGQHLPGAVQGPDHRLDLKPPGPGRPHGKPHVGLAVRQLPRVAQALAHPLARGGEVHVQGVHRRAAQLAQRHRDAEPGRGLLAGRVLAAAGGQQQA